MADLSVRIGEVALKNPVIAASGTFGFGAEYAPIFDPGLLGGICSKGITREPREGNPPPRLWETPCGLLNSIGLENPGIEAFVREVLPRMLELGTVVIVNIWGREPEEYAYMAERLDMTEAHVIELNLSCPNVPGAGLPGANPEKVAAIVAAARAACGKPLWAKLPPEGDLIGAARAAAEAGASAVTVANTFRGMAIDIRSRRPVFKTQRRSHRETSSQARSKSGVSCSPKSTTSGFTRAPQPQRATPSSRTRSAIHSSSYLFPQPVQVPVQAFPWISRTVLEPALR